MGDSCVHKALANKLLNWWREIILGCRLSFFGNSEAAVTPAAMKPAESFGADAAARLPSDRQDPSAGSEEQPLAPVDSRDTLRTSKCRWP